jgi:hypothetical protein
MTPFGAVVFALDAITLLALPRRWATLAIIVGCCYMTRAGVQIGPATFTALRMLIVVGLLRVFLRGEWRLRLNGLDGWMIAWGTCLIVSVAFHKDASAQLLNRFGLTFDAWGLYFLFRMFCQSQEDLTRLARILAVAFVPLAIEMLIEKATAHNFFSLLGGVPEVPMIRDGKVRASGPFDLCILAGTIAAASLPLILSLWKSHRKTALAGCAAALGMVVASTSSGPILTAAWGVFGLMLWPYRSRTRLMRWGLVVAYVALDLVMKDPAYYVMARIDLTGSSTGWHRARLIQEAIRHWSEWWLTGTDYTRHWMPYGIPWSDAHVDITNHYLEMGVLGGLPLMFLFVAVVAKAFSLIGASVQDEGQPAAANFMAWAVGSMLLAHAVTFLSVSYYDQSVTFVFLTLAVAAGLQSAVAAVPVVVRLPSGIPPQFGPPNRSAAITSARSIARVRKPA